MRGLLVTHYTGLSQYAMSRREKIGAKESKVEAYTAKTQWCDLLVKGFGYALGKFDQLMSGGTYGGSHTSNGEL